MTTAPAPAAPVAGARTPAAIRADLGTLAATRDRFFTAKTISDEELNAYDLLCERLIGDVEPLLDQLAPPPPTPGEHR